MPTKLRNIIFIAICICALSIAFIYQGAKWVHVLPASFNNGTFSYLENANLQGRPSPSYANIKNGTFQKQVEKWIDTKIPKRDSVMLFNAKVQRGIIKTANLACRFDTIPTYFGSNYVYDYKIGIIAPLAHKTSIGAGSLKNAAEAINDFINSQSVLTSFTVAIPDEISVSESNPTYALVSNAQGRDFRWENFVSQLSPEVNYVDLSCENEYTHSLRYFFTDTHWNITGAASAYSKIMKTAYPTLNETTLKNLITYEEPNYYGNMARRGLLLPAKPDKIQDYVVDLDSTTITINDSQVSYEDISHSKLFNEHQYSTQELIDRYTEYFHGNVAKLKFETDNKTSRNLLILGDSYSNCCEKFFAKSFDKVVRIDRRHNTDALSDIIEEEHITDVLLLVVPSRLNASVLTRWAD